MAFHAWVGVWATALLAPVLLLGQSPLERSYGAPKEEVWNAVLTSLSKRGIHVKKADKDRGQIEADSIATPMEYLDCALERGRGQPPPQLFFRPQPSLEISIREASSNSSSVRIKMTDRKHDASMGGFIGRVVCISNGKLEQVLFEQIGSHLEAAK